MPASVGRQDQVAIGSLRIEIQLLAELLAVIQTDIGGEGELGLRIGPGQVLSFGSGDQQAMAEPDR